MTKLLKNTCTREDKILEGNYRDLERDKCTEGQVHRRC